MNERNAELAAGNAAEADAFFAKLKGGQDGAFIGIWTALQSA